MKSLPMILYVWNSLLWAPSSVNGPSIFPPGYLSLFTLLPSQPPTWVVQGFFWLHLLYNFLTQCLPYAYDFHSCHPLSCSLKPSDYDWLLSLIHILDSLPVILSCRMNGEAMTLMGRDALLKLCKCPYRKKQAWRGQRAPAYVTCLTPYWADRRMLILTSFLIGASNGAEPSSLDTLTPSHLL